MKKQFHLTKAGHDELSAELKNLIDNRHKIAEEIASARSQGDLSENAEYHEAKEEQGRQEARIEEIQNILQNADIITAPKGDSEVVLGSTVKLKSAEGSAKEFQVVGTVEADPLNGKISDESPIGQALLGQKEGASITIKDTSFKIVDIS